MDEFKKGIESSCKGKTYSDFPEAFKFFIDSSFRTIDINGDGNVGIDEFRFDCVNRAAYKSIQDLDDAYNKLLNVSPVARNISVKELVSSVICSWLSIASFRLSTDGRF